MPLILPPHPLPSLPPLKPTLRLLSDSQTGREGKERPPPTPSFWRTLLHSIGILLNGEGDRARLAASLLSCIRGICFFTSTASATSLLRFFFRDSAFSASLLSCFLLLITSSSTTKQLNSSSFRENAHATRTRATGVRRAGKARASAASSATAAAGPREGKRPRPRLTGNDRRREKHGLPRRGLRQLECA